ncbi:MAG: hypothetical protein VB042_09630 [Victivallaceae bacterium]|nr:hypothetical protein [Victivallaceae bacterium]
MVSLALTALLAAVVVGIGCDNSEANGNDNGSSTRVFSAADVIGYWSLQGGHDAPDGQTWIFFSKGRLFLITKNAPMPTDSMAENNYVVVPGTWRIEPGNELYINLHDKMLDEGCNISIFGVILEIDANKMVLGDINKDPTDILIRIGKGSAMEHAIISILDDHGCKIED